MIHAQRIYNVLFPGDIPPELESRFADAWLVLADDYTNDENREFENALALGGDLEAIELAGRRQGRLAVLVDQVRLMCLLAETSPRHSQYFIQNKGNRLAACFAMAAAGFRAATAYAKGVYALRRMSKDDCHDHW